jgi:protein SMG6
MVCDTNLFLSQLDVFWLMADTAGWPIVIPNSVITELTGLSKNTTPVGREADGALRAIKSAIDLGRDITIVTSKGNNVTRQGNFFKEQIESYDGEGQRNLDEIIIQTTKQQAQLKRGIHQSADGDARGGDGRAKPAVLVTEDRAMRVKASAYGVAAVAASMVRRVIVPPRKRDSREDSGTGKSSPSATTTGII